MCAACRSSRRSPSRRTMARRPRLQVRRRPPELALRRRGLRANSSTSCASTARWPSGPPIRRGDGPAAGRAAPSSPSSSQDRWRINDRLSSSWVSARTATTWSSGQLLAARGAGAQRAARGTRHPARRVRQVRRAHAAHRRRLHAVRRPTVRRFAADGTPLGPAVTFVHPVAEALQTPESIVQTVAWDERFGRRFFFKAGTPPQRLARLHGRSRFGAAAR